MDPEGLMGLDTSVIIPVRNGAAFIVEAIASALPQLKAGDEIVVVDDGSTDVRGRGGGMPGA
jgi:glycosyltransferase involved in cell wall biosynthesis